MNLNIHTEVLGAVFVVAVIMGAVTSKTNFCAMGAVSDWVNIGNTGRMRAWVFSMAVALAGVIGGGSRFYSSQCPGSRPRYRKPT